MESAAARSRGRPALRLLCPKASLLSPPCPSPLRWLVGTPRVLPPFTVAAALRSLHADPDLPREADEIRGLLLRGFDIVGALLVSGESSDADATRALELSQALRERLFGEAASHGMVGGYLDAATREIRFVASESDGSEVVEGSEVVWEDEPGRLLWEKGCLLRCELPLKLPLYVPADQMSGIEERFSSLIETTAAKFRDPHVSYLVEGPATSPNESHCSIILYGDNLSSVSHLPHDTSTKECSANSVSCSEFFSAKRYNLSLTRENADAIQVTVLSNQSVNSSMAGTTPVVEYFPAPALASLRIINLKLDILCYSSKDCPVASAVSELVIPGLVDQMTIMKKVIVSEITQQPQLCPYHFIPPGLLIPVTAIYDTRYGEIEEKQSELRRNLHIRLGLPLDRPLLRISNALTFCSTGKREKSASRNGFSLLRDVHREIPSSGVSGGIMSLIDGSYEYYHYLHDGIDDNGWGCAYRSLQTIVSWYRLQQYSSIDVPSHREIQQVLVEIGDKDPSFIGSREWIGAIELSFALDKLLGVSCKIINVRSGDELPEKCRELAMHFETQGTPVMIGGGVLAYTLLGVDYNEASGDCAFLILDPHYTGADDLKKIVNGGWCGWKKSVDSKGRNFFLKDKFYNLLLPQRPNMV
ncbi:probable Ufm1-specific protease [Phragmites australis]|uniref:probable Ufm1-specific protease n=1 Tax=Phragmites australis TaxID=29695 RepID=UPI002D7851AA|nr:probable Ufm1-specific protease [Phragmites australis]